MKRVLQVNLDDAGGAFSLMLQAQHLMSDGIIFDYFTMDCFKNDEVKGIIEKLGGKIIEASLRKNRLIGHLLLPVCFIRKVRKEKYEIVHIHSDTAWKLLLYAVSANILKIKTIIVHAHSSGVSGDYRWLKRFIHELAKPVLPHFSTMLLSCSDNATRWMYPEKFTDKVMIIHNGVDADKFTFDLSSRYSIRKELGVNDDDVIIGTVGDYSYPKNPLALLDIFSVLYRQSKVYKLAFVGDGYGRREVEQYAKKKGVSDRVFFLGKCLDMSKIYSSLDIFIMTSRFEGVPMSALEAQANGLKCFLSNKITKNVKILDDCEFFDYEDYILCSKKIRNYVDNHLKYLMGSHDVEYTRRIRCSLVVKESDYNIRNTVSELKIVYRASR